MPDAHGLHTCQHGVEEFPFLCGTARARHRAADLPFQPRESDPDPFSEIDRRMTDPFVDTSRRSVPDRGKEGGGTDQFLLRQNPELSVFRNQADVLRIIGKDSPGRIRNKRKVLLPDHFCDFLR